MCIDRAGVGESCVVPYIMEQLLARLNPSTAFGHGFEQLELSRGQPDDSSPPAHIVAVHVNDEIAKMQAAPLRVAGRSAVQSSFDAQQ